MDACERRIARRAAYNQRRSPGGRGRAHPLEPRLLAPAEMREPVLASAKLDELLRPIRPSPDYRNGRTGVRASRYAVNAAACSAAHCANVRAFRPVTCSTVGTTV